MRYLIVIVVLVAVILAAGCASENKKTDVTPVKTTIPTGIISTTSSSQTIAKPTTLVPTPTPSPKFLTFNGQGIVFDYPSYLSEAASLQQMRNIMQSQGLEVITVLVSSDNSLTLQVARQQNPATIDSLYNDKRGVADTVNSQGMTLMGEKFVKYSVSKITFPKKGTLVMGYAEKDNGQTGINYWQLHGGYEYGIMFIYPNSQRADKDQVLRDTVINSMNFN
jgi:hypothetical protein